MWTIIGTALLAAVLTVALGGATCWYLYQRHLRSLIEAEVARRVERYGALLEQRVRTGIVSAVEDVTSVRALQKSVARNQDTLLDALFGVRTTDRD